MAFYEIKGDNTALMIFKDVLVLVLLFTFGETHLDDFLNPKPLIG